MKPTGSLYLHCDPTASHYLKVVMDAIFGAKGFRSDITWRRTRPKGLAFRGYPNSADQLLYYSQSDAFTWNRPFAPHDPAYVAKFYRHVEPGTGRRYRLDNLANPNKDRPNLTYEFLGVRRVWRWTRERMQAAYDAGRVVQLKPGRVPRYKRYLDEMPGTPVDTIWEDVKSVQPHAAERLGYPTQKPVALLERIIKASSNPGDLVLDPFCGCGTTVAAARQLGRQWAGIDISPVAVDVIRERLADPSIPAYGMPADLAAAAKLAAERPFDFEAWAVTRLQGFVPNTRQVGDGGVDGRATLWEPPEGLDSRLALAQVKGGKFSLSMLRDFGGVLERDGAALGCYVTLEPVRTAAARAEAAAKGTVTVGGATYPRLQPWSLAAHFDGRPPALPLMADPYTGRPLQPRMV